MKFIGTWAWRLPLFVCVWVRLVFRTCGLWAGERSLSSCWCCCRWTRLCVWACCSWTCWAIAFSFSGYSWASSERICHTGQGRIEGVSLSGTTLAAAFCVQICEIAFRLTLTWSSSIILTERSFSSCCLNSIISLLRSSVFSSSRMSGDPIPSSFSSARLLLGEEPLNSYGGRTENEWICVKWTINKKAALSRFQVRRWPTCMIRLSWLFCCNSRVFSCSKVKMYSAVCCRMAACGKREREINNRVTGLFFEVEFRPATSYI